MSVGTHLSCFHILVVVTNATVNIHVTKFYVDVFIYFGSIGGELLSHKVILWDFEKLLFSTVNV